MLFSVVIPAYNEENYLSDCIKSIQNQVGNFSYEVIVVDNNSIDNTATIARDLGVKVIEEKKLGVGFARKTGTDLAVGEYIVCLDADSRLPSDYLLKVKSKFDKNKDLVCLGGQFYFYDGIWWQNFLRAILFRPTYFITFVLSFGKIGPIANNMTFKREIYNKTTGFDPNLKYGEDGNLTIKLSKFGKIRMDMNLKCFVSSRRFNKLDKNFYIYFWNAVWVVFFGRPYKNGLEYLKKK